MADKAVANKIWSLKKKISDEETKRNEWAATLPGIEEFIALGGEEGAEGEKLKADAEEAIADHDATLAQLRAELAELEAQLPKKEEPAAPKFDPEKHPLLKKATEKVEPAKPVVFSAGDICEAQWTDRQWYKVKVQTVLGSASDPKYHVRFLDYKDSTLTVGRDTIRPLGNDKKRKADTAPPTPTAAPATNSPHVISGPASLNPQALAAKQEAGQDAGAASSRRKLGGNKALERKMSSWQSFQKKGPGKALVKKDSQFRTGEGPNSRVGFTGSGAGMTQAPKRVRYNAKAEEEGQAEETRNRDDRRSGSRW